MFKRFFVLTTLITCLANFSHINAMVNPKRIHTYGQRIEYCKNPIAQKLLGIMEDKKSNLAFSIDVKDKTKFLRLADQIGPHICILKTHCDIVRKFDKEFYVKMRMLAEKHNFLIFEDRKFGDIGSTVKEQYTGGVLEIVNWADIVNAHAVPGDGVIQGLRSGKEDAACLLIAQMSSANALTNNDDYVKATIEFAKKYPKNVIGFICLEKLLDDPGILHFTTGVNLDVRGDKLGQQYLTPEKVINESGSDIIIAGRGIYDDSTAEAQQDLSEEALKEALRQAQRYQKAGWDAYQRSINRAKL
ncbi:MAG TPA: orotidine-5'-phosphate decarboxylase [Candidatus Babeliales bacterium]|nr:orotidine-5'-phosphate decarboxylase [Candidatus Babeliales bacterium]